MRSKVAPAVDENKGTGLPVDGVSVTLKIGSEKLMMEVLAGEASEMDTLTAALPFWQFVVHPLKGPLQEVKARVVRTRMETPR